MNKNAQYCIETVKVLRTEERGSVGSQFITSTDAAKASLPQNCVVMPMQILEHPEPIKRRKKNSSR